MCLQVDTLTQEDTDQSVQMCRLVSVFAGLTYNLEGNAVLQLNYQTNCYSDSRFMAEEKKAPSI